VGGSLVPALDPAPLPGPPWLFQVLWVLTFLIHLVFVNVVLGGTVLAAVAARRDAYPDTVRFFNGINTWAISLAITFAIAPLLFVQVMLGRFFYSATVLVGWAWFSVLVLVAAGYYLNYIVKARLRSGGGVRALLVFQALCFLAVAAVQVTVNLLHAQPGRWERVADQAWAALADPSWVPRYFHFVLAAISMSGIFLARIAVARAGAPGGPPREALHGAPAKAASGAEASASGGASRGPAARPALDAMARYGIRAALVTTAAQIASGFWLLFAVPRETLLAFFRQGAATGVPLLIGIVAGAWLLFVLVQIRDPLAEPRRVKRAVELILAAMVFMVVTRQQLRGTYLAAAPANEKAAVSPQWGMVFVFAVTFVIAVTLTVFAIVRAVKDRPGPGEEAA
jgi:hypothetical protein